MKTNSSWLKTSIAGVLMTVVGLYTQLAWADTKLDEAIKKRECLVKLGTLTAESQRLNEIWLTNRDTRYNISLNIQAIDEKHAAYLRGVEELRSSFLSQATNLTDIFKQMELLDEKFRQQYDRLSAVAQADEIFNGSLNLLNETLFSILQRANDLGRTCNKELGEAPALLASDVSSWNDTVGQVVAYIQMTKQKRKNFLLIVKESLRLDLERKWSAKVGEDLANLHIRTQKLLDALALQREVLYWYRNFATSGVISNLRNQYLQYEAPLQALYAGLNEGHAFLKRLASLGTQNEVEAKIKSELDSYLATIQAAIRDLEGLGWQGLLTRQKMLNQKRLTMLDKLGAGCQAAIEQYNQKTTDIKTQSDFRIAEQAYIPIYDHCKLK